MVTWKGKAAQYPKAHAVQQDGLSSGDAGISPAVRDRVLQALTAVMAEPEVRKKLQNQSMEPAMLGPQALRDVMDSEIARYRALVARANIRID